MLPVSNSMRANYANGVAAYYTEHASTDYRNPHYPGILKTLSTFLDVFWENTTTTRHLRDELRILDMAAGSGEATLAVQSWLDKRRGTKRSAPKDIHVVATDPYTGPAYLERTGSPCLPLSFNDIADGKLEETMSRDAATEEGRASSSQHTQQTQEPAFDIVICSFALHLVEEQSQLWALLHELAQRSTFLVVLAPHKKPTIKPEWDWARVDPWTMVQVDENQSVDPSRMGGKRGDGYEIYDERVRLRVWQSRLLGFDDEDA